MNKKGEGLNNEISNEDNSIDFYDFKNNDSLENFSSDSVSSEDSQNKADNSNNGVLLNDTNNNVLGKESNFKGNIHHFVNVILSKIKNRILFYVILTCSAVLFLFLGVYLFYSSNKKSIVKTFNYASNGRVNYVPYYNDEKVNYTTFVRGYLTDVDFNFNYSISFSDRINGKALYSVSAYWFAYNTGNTNEEIYKSESEDLTPLSEKDLKSQIYYGNSISAKLDYRKYLQKYLTYKSNSQVASQAMVVVEYKINSSVKPSGMKNITSDDTITAQIPLSESTFKISTKTSANRIPKLVNKVNNNDKTKGIKKAFGVISIIISIVNLALLVVVYVDDILSKSLYERKLNKIINSYDNIIVDVDELPNTNGKDVINVKEFDELLDAQTQVGMPINFKEEETGAIFMLVQEDMAWVYHLDKNN